MVFRQASLFGFFSLLNLLFFLSFSHFTAAQAEDLNDPSRVPYVDLEDESLAIALAVGLNRLKNDHRCTDYPAMVVVPGHVDDGLVLTIGAVGEALNCWVSVGYKFLEGESPQDAVFELLWITPITVETPKSTSGIFRPSKSKFERLMM